MIGTKLYRARVNNGKVELLEETIFSTKRKFHYFDKGEHKSCRKADVGVTVFLTPNEAVDYLIKKLERSVVLGVAYLERERQQLRDAKAFFHPEVREDVN